MTQSSMSTPYSRRLAEKFKESQAYLRANGFQNKNHPLKNDIFLYNTYPFEMYENKRTKKCKI